MSSIASSRILDRWIFWGLLAVLFWAPLPLGSNRTWASSLLVLWSQVLLLGAVFVWRANPQRAFERLYLFRWPIALLAAFVLLVAFQLIPMPAALLAVLSPETLAVADGVAQLRLTLDYPQTQMYAALSFAYWSFFVVAILTVRDARRLDQLTQMVVYAGLLQAIIGAVLFSIGAKYRFFFFDVAHSRVFGTFGYHNHMAGYMEICLSVGIGLMLARLGTEPALRGDWRTRLTGVIDFVLSPKMRLRLMLVIMVIALVLTRSRMGNTGFFAAMLIVGALAILLSRKTAPATIGLIASLIIIDVVVVGTWVGLEKVVNRVQETSISNETAGREETVEQRVAAAQHAMDLVADFPAFGTGGGSFYHSYMRYRVENGMYFDHAHNDYVELAADYGLVGLGLLGAFVLVTGGRAIWVLKRRRSSLPRGVAFGALMAMVALAIHSWVDFNLQLPANALTLVLVMAMCWIASELPSSGASGSEVPSPRKRRRRERRAEA